MAPKWGAGGSTYTQVITVHGRISEQLNNLLNGEEELPETLTFGRMILCLKDPSKGNAVDNFRPNSCLPLTWKLMTGVIAEVMYEYLNEILTGEEEEKLED